ncbi:hypothetical protein VNPA120719_53350 [Pseudomonas aeruginosa]|nr:hypothetical protein VNPA110516_55830 [Pseudomonas aeruginosa]GLE78874.1 hypothetical protein VNPA120641_57460 [Pseudomonas aeruginosa]GLE91939.1 hypothetical protein VNPA120719_53350 [Pseudomonas aeruginosa]
MVINYFDFFGTRIRPDETDTPLVIDPDAMLARPLSLQRLQAVSRWRAQVSKLRSRMKHCELTRSDCEDRSPPPRKTRLKKLTSLVAAKGQNQSLTLNVKR